MNAPPRNITQRIWAYIVGIGILFVIWATFSILDGINRVRKEQFRLAISQADVISRVIFATQRWAMRSDGATPSTTQMSRIHPSIEGSRRSIRAMDSDKDEKLVNSNHVSMMEFIQKVMDTEGFHIHIVSLKTSHPEEMPDNDWERVSLDKIGKGSVKEDALLGTPGNRIFRHMEPIKVDAG